MTLEAWMKMAHEQMLWIEAHRHPVLDVVFIALSALGAEGFLILFVSVGYWLFDRQTFARATAMLLVAGLLNTWLKGTFLVPRPSVSHVWPASGWSFPSGHAQVAGALWGWLAVEAWPRRGLALGLCVLAVLISASRPYLGVHYPHDVVAGLALGALQVAAAARVARYGAAELGWSRLLGVAVVATGAAFGLSYVFDESVRGSAIRLFGASVGLVVGFGAARRLGLNAPPESTGGRVKLLAVGVLGVVAIWIGLKAVLSAAGLADAAPAAYGRYLLLGLWIAVGAPWLVRPRWSVPAGSPSPVELDVSRR